MTSPIRRAEAFPRRRSSSTLLQSSPSTVEKARRSVRTEGDQSRLHGDGAVMSQQRWLEQRLAGVEAEEEESRHEAEEKLAPHLAEQLRADIDSRALPFERVPR